MVEAISYEGLSKPLRFTNVFKGTRNTFRRGTDVSAICVSSGPGGKAILQLFYRGAMVPKD